jgi:hypothetical protein
MLAEITKVSFHIEAEVEGMARCIGIALFLRNASKFRKRNTCL